MSLDGFFRRAAGSNLILWPLCLLFGLVVILTLSVVLLHEGHILEITSGGQFMGTLALFSLLPSYLLWMILLLKVRTSDALVALAKHASATDVERVNERMLHLSSRTPLYMIFGLVFGLTQNSYVLGMTVSSGHWYLLDLVFLTGNGFLWITVAVVLCWRIPVSAALAELGTNIKADLYRPSILRPLARLATTDILAVTGALALVPLQSLDAEFRLGNYLYGWIIGVPAALVLFVLPLWGAHKNLRRLRTARLAELDVELESVDRRDITHLEAVTAHLDRVRSISSWPIDVQLFTRILVYVVLPPLAWVAAALVENLIDAL